MHFLLVNCRWGQVVQSQIADKPELNSKSPFWFMYYYQFLNRHSFQKRQIKTSIAIEKGKQIQFDK